MKGLKDSSEARIEARIKELDFVEEQLKDFESPIVYIFIKEDKRIIDLEKRKQLELILYIGKSKNGLYHIFNSQYEPKKEARKEANKMKLLICESNEQAIKLEVTLIQIYKPKYNKPFNNSYWNLVQTSSTIEELKQVNKDEAKKKADEMLKDLDLIKVLKSSS